MMTDPLADMLTRIRNANRIELPFVDMPATRLKANVAQVLKDEGFILDYQVGKVGSDESGQPTFTPETDLTQPKLKLRIFMKYGLEGERVIRAIDRASKPGRAERHRLPVRLEAEFAIGPGKALGVVRSVEVRLAVDPLVRLKLGERAPAGVAQGPVDQLARAHVEARMLRAESLGKAAQ